MGERPERGRACAGRRKASTCVVRSPSPPPSLPPCAAPRHVPGRCAGGQWRRPALCSVTPPPPSRTRPLCPGASAAAAAAAANDDDDDGWETAEGEPDEYTNRALGQLRARDNHVPADWTERGSITAKRYGEAANGVGGRHGTFDTIELYDKRRESQSDSTTSKKSFTRANERSNDAERKNLIISSVQIVESDDTMYSAREGSIDTMYSAHSFTDRDNGTTEDSGWQGFEKSVVQRDGSLVTMYSALSDTEESVRGEASQAEREQRTSPKGDRERLSLTEHKEKLTVVERGPDLPERDGALRPAKPSRRSSSAVKTASRATTRGPSRYAHLTGPSDLTGSFRFVEVAGPSAVGGRGSHRRRCSVFSTQPPEDLRCPARFRFERPTRDGDPEVARLRFDLTVSKLPGSSSRGGRADAPASVGTGSRRASRAPRRRRLEECVCAVVKELAAEMAQQQQHSAGAVSNALPGRPPRATAYPVAGEVAVPIWSLQAPPRGGGRPEGSGGCGGGAGGGGGGCYCGSRPCSAAPSLGSTGPDICRDGCEGENVRAWRRVWSSVHLAEDAAAAATADADAADAGLPPPCACACACTCAVDRRPPQRALPHRYSCPRCTMTRHDADREASLRRHLWSAEDARPLRQRWAGSACYKRRPAARTACCTCFSASARRDGDGSFGAWDRRREPSGWEMGCRCCAECDRLERNLQQWNRERASRSLWDEEDRRPSRWEPVQNHSSRWRDHDRFEMGNRRRRLWGDEDSWNRSRVFQCPCTSDRWDEPVTETTSSDGTDGASSFDAEQDPFLRRHTTLNYRVDREIPRNRTGIGPYYESPTRQRACENFAEVARLSAAKTSLPVSPVVSEPSRFNDVLGQEVHASKTFCNPEDSVQGTVQDNYFLLAPPAHFSTGSNAVENSRKEINPLLVSTSAETNGQIPRSSTVLGVGEVKSRVSEVPEKGIRVSETTSQFFYQTIVSRARDTKHTKSNGADGQNIVMRVSENYNKVIPGVGYSGENVVSESTNIRVSRGTTVDFPDIKNNEHNAQKSGGRRVMTEISQVREGEPLLETIISSSITRTCGNANDCTPFSVPNNWSDDSTATVRSANFSASRSGEIRESIHRDEPITEDGDILQLRELFNKCSLSNATGMPGNTFEAAWNVIEKSSIFKNVVDKHNREMDAIGSGKKNSSKECLRFISSSQVPEIVNAARNVIKTSGLFKDKLEKLGKSSDVSSQFKTIPSVEPHPPVLSGSEIFHSASSVIETPENSNHKQDKETATGSNSFRDGTQHATTSNAETEIVHAAWNVIETSSAFKEELERLTKSSSAVDNRRTETTPKTHSTEILGILDKPNARCESPSQKRQKRSKRHEGGSQGPSISGERAVLSMTDFNDGKEIVQKAWDLIKKSDEFSCLSCRHRSVSSEAERRDIGGGGGGDGRSEIGSVTTQKCAGDSKEKTHESRTEVERMNADRSVITKRNAGDKCRAAFGELNSHENELIHTAHTCVLETGVPASCAGILSSSRHSYTDDMYRKPHDKKVHFRTPEKQDSAMDARKKIHPPNAPTTSRECTDENVLDRTQTTTLTNNASSPMKSSALCSSILQISPVDVYAYEAADVFNTIAHKMRNFNSTTKDQFNQITTSKEIGYREMRSAGTTTSYSEAETLIRSTTGVPTDNNKQSTPEQAESNEAYLTSRQNAGVQTNLRKEERVRIPKEHSDKCIQAEQIPSERIVCSTHINDTLGWHQTFPRWSPAKGFQADTLGTCERSTTNNEIKCSKYIQVNQTKSLR